MEVWIKPHPGNPISLSDYPKLKAEITNQSLVAILPKVNVAITSVFTSASVDAFCYGIPVLEYLDESFFNFSSLRGEASTRYISVADDLVQSLKDLRNWRVVSIKSQNYFWLNEDLNLWHDLLKNNPSL